MKIYVNKNNPSEFQQGASFPNSVLIPAHYTLADLPYLTISTSIVEDVEVN